MNCEFITANINYWPSVFLIAIKDIKKGDQLWSYYGNEYQTAIENAKDCQKQKQERMNHIENVIVKDGTLSTTQVEEYIV